MNMNIFGFQIFYEYEYEYIRGLNFQRIQIYSGSKFSLNMNISGILQKVTMDNIEELV
jgi:hypothetical protein